MAISATNGTVVAANLFNRNTLESQGNGDFRLTPAITGISLAVDMVGGSRQVAAAAQSSALLLTQSASTVSRVAGAVVPFGLLFTGPIVMGLTAKTTIPDAYEALEGAKMELAQAEADGNETLIEEGQHAVSLAKLGVAHNYLIFGMGAAQTAAGAAVMMTPETAHVLHYAPLLAGKAATVALTATSVALGAAYTVRGGVMFYRTLKAYLPVREFRKSFHESLAEGTAIILLKKTEALGATYLERRVDPACLDYKDEKGNVVGKYTAGGVVNEVGKVIKTGVEAEYLARVDKGIYTQELKYKVGLIIAAAMILGGITAIVLTVLTGGIAGLVIALASAIFFMSMEYIFFTYDSTAIFEKLRDKLYTSHKSLSVNKLDTILEETLSLRRCM